MIYIGALGLSCVFCWTDKDTLGALVILLGLWCLSRVLLILPENEYSLVVVYIFCIFTALYCIKQLTAKVTLIIIVSSIGAELFWWHSAYVDKPHIYYYLGVLCVTELARELLVKRVFILSEYFDLISGKVALDWQIRGILFSYYMLIVFMLMEYFVRHLSSYHNTTFVYDNYSFVATIISGLTLVIIYMHYFHNQAKKYIAA
ncbi:MAG: hypothetical protein ACI9UT_000676 [Flavobacteriales bacterium]